MNLSDASSGIKNLEEQKLQILRLVFELCLSFLVPCKWGPWTEFSKCDKSCGGGKTFRTRTKLVTEKYGGTCQGLAKSEKECNIQDCPGKL